ncbi:MAG: efflux RND transporter permease subunit [Prevotella sp.]|nr:efflux RND transporter permease subunit [Prevotella sp.]
MTFTNFIKRPVLSTVISILIVLLGVIGLVSLPIEQYPDIAPPTVAVWTSYPGADAETVKNSVITPLEESINGVEGMDYISSTASTGSAQISVLFRQGMNPDMCAVNVQNRVQQAQALLPAEVTRMGVTVQKRQTSQVLMFSLTSVDGRYDDEFLTNYNNINIIPAIKRIQGVGDVQSPGLKTYSMRIWLKPDVMKQYGLMPSDINNVLAEQNVEAAPGTFGEQSDVAYEYAMRYTGRLKTAEEFGDIIIQSNPDGTTLKLKEVARIELGGQQYSVSMKNNNLPSVLGMVQQIAGSNANEIAKQVKAELEEQAKLFPPGMIYKINYDVTEFLYASIEEVVFTLIFTLILVFIVIYIFLQDWRSTLIPLIAVPVSLIGTFFFLEVFGFSINLLTLSALLLAIAIVVDDAIVVVEAVHAKLDQGYKSTLTASIDAMNEISGAIISITLVMASVFIPVSFIGGTSGTFYREFGVTMAVSIFISALNALTLSPALCAIFLKPHDKDGHEKKMSVVDRFHASFNTAYDGILGKYKKVIEKFVRRPVLIMVVVIIGIVALVGSLLTTKTGLVPDEDTGTIFCTISMPPATSVERTKQVISEVDSILGADPAIQSREQIQGYNFIAGSGSDQATFIMKLKPFSERQKGFWWKLSGLWEGDGIYRFFLNPLESNGVIAQIFIKTAHIKDAQILAFSPPMIPGFSANSGVSIVMQDRTGGSLDKFFGIVKDYLAELNKRPEFQTAQTSYNPNYPQYMVHVDVAKCKQSGISPATILSTLQGYYGGLYASNFNAYGKLYRVMIQASPETRKTLESLNNIYVRTNSGEMAPIQEFCQLERVYGPSNINRFNLFTSINVTATVANGYSTGEAIKAAQEVAAEMLPTGYTYDYQGLTREEAKASNSTGIIFLLCLIFIYLILSAQYESYILPLAVILSVPFGLAGCFLFTNVFGHANDIYMQISLIMLIGLLAKNAILIVQFALERRQTGMAISWSATLGAAARLRPILMTSLAMIIGLLPLMFASGVGKNGNQTLGAAAVGGMLVGTLLQIFVVPTLFTLFQTLQEKVSPMKFDDEEGNEDVAAELQQYAHSTPVDYTIEK